jgi:hypothetical protein
MTDDWFDEAARRPTFWVQAARDARLVAYTLLKSRQRVEELTAGCQFTGIPDLALSAGYAREIALAIELALKAVIAHRATPPATHNLLELSQLAGIDWSAAEELVLTRLTSVLYWSGRYPVPTSQKRLQQEVDRLAAAYAAANVKTEDGLSFTELNFGWETFDPIYQKIFADIKTDLD